MFDPIMYLSMYNHVCVHLYSQVKHKFPWAWQQTFTAQHIYVSRKMVTKMLHIQTSLINDLSEIYMSWIQNYSQKVTCTRHKQTFQTMSCLVRFVHFWNLGLVCFFSYSVTSCFKLLLHLFGMFRNTWMKLRKIKNVTLKSLKFINNLNSTRHS